MPTITHAHPSSRPCETCTAARWYARYGDQYATATEARRGYAHYRNVRAELAAIFAMDDAEAIDR